MEHLKGIKNTLISLVETELMDAKCANTHEMGEVIDMIKDLEEAMYYCSIIEAMERANEEKEKGNGGEMNVNYYMEPMSHDGNRYSAPDRSMNSRYYVPYMEYAPYMMRDEGWRESRLGDKSAMSRRMYMEGKLHNDDQKSMQELEHYIKDLGEDLTDMIKESSQEEKQVLSSKLQQLAAKVST